MNIKQSILRPLAHATYNRNPFFAIKRYLEVLREFSTYRRMVREQNLQENVSFDNYFPWIMEKFDQAGLASFYFYQDTWAARKIFENRPNVHVDIGSSLVTAGVISQLVPLVYVDVRPLTSNLEGFTFKQGDLMALPFESDSLPSISSLSVVEHVGLARYGDKLDPLGTDRACAEMSRCLGSRGNLYVAVPTEKISSTHFNAHRIFNPDDFIAKFSGLQLLEERYGTDSGIYTREQYESQGMPYAYGCFQFTKSSPAG